MRNRQRIGALFVCLLCAGAVFAQDNKKFCDDAIKKIQEGIALLKNDADFVAKQQFAGAGSQFKDSFSEVGGQFKSAFGEAGKSMGLDRLFGAPEDFAEEEVGEGRK